MNNQWSDNLRKRMEKHQEASPEGLWEDIEQIMRKEYSIKPLSTSRKILLWSKRIGVAAAIVIIALVIGYYIPEQSGENISLVIETPEKQHIPEKEIIVLQRKNDIIAKDNGLFPSQNTGKEKVIPEKEISPTDTISITGKERDKAIQEIAKDDNLKSHPKPEQVKDKNLYAQSSQHSGSEYNLNLFEYKQKDKSAKLVANLYASNLSSDSRGKHNGYGSLGASEMYLDYDEEGRDPYGDILDANQYKEVYTDIKHRQPVTIGVSLNYHLNRKWSLTSGLTYTILYSELQSGSNKHYYSSEQTLHNIGIPLNINYNIWSNKKFSIYLSAGGHVERNVSGKLTTDYIVNNKLESTTKDNISINQLQWSLNTSAGIKYNLSEKIGLYMEPGASYYFKNKSEIETIYKEKPLNMSLRIGVSFSLEGK